MKYNLLDLFAGAGGMTLGFFQNGFKIVETIEIWKPAIETYNYNFNLSVLPSDITNSYLRKEIENKFKNKIDVIIGGFPCQGFSMAGKRSKSDPRNQLYNYTIDVIKKVRPYYFVLENVKGILSFRESDGELVVEKIKNKLRRINYYVNFILVDSSNFGVPQKRERVFFIGSNIKNKKKVDECIELIKNHKERIVTVYDAISDLENCDENVEINHIFSKHSEEMIEKIKKTPMGKSVMRNFSDAFRRLYYDRPSTTVKENHGGVHIHPIRNRVLTPRELARLQSFPDNFLFKSNKANILKQIGNAVPPKLAFEISKITKKVFYEQ